MAKRDPAKTARNKEAAALDERLAALLPDTLNGTGCGNVHQLNAKIGGKYQQLMNIKERCITTCDEFISLYMDALAREIRSTPPYIRHSSAFYRLAKWYQDEPAFQRYMELFLQRTFLRHFDEIARVKPPAAAASFWIGQNNADYGLLITPRFNERLKDWENDKSEIRRFKPDYYTIGHILEAGLVIPGKYRRRKFDDVDDYLGFFQDILVRNAGSKHQDEVAKHYAQFVRGRTTGQGAASHP
ncbi:MAG TPA: hypothetical protein VK797_03220 [Tepidisphaeraceae bacterium]|jgi:hypothetical protein|nr:hypothetical protein [Tepidisphaeraceae bacterium]